MSSTALEARAEMLVHEAIDDISEELGIPVTGYPTVFYSQKYRKKIENCYHPKTESIVLSHLHHAIVGEESAHFIHCTLANPSPKETKWDHLTWYALVETFGFFGSKLFAPQRKPTWHYSSVPSLHKNKKNLEEVAGSIALQSLATYRQPDIFEEWTHREGCVLGEGLYHAYLSGFISAREIRNFFSKPYDKPDEALNAFLQLKYNVEHPQEKNKKS